MRITFALPFVLATVSVTAAAAEEFATRQIDAGFDDTTLAVESAIVGAGLVIDHVSHVADMLARTKADVGGTKDLYTDGQIFSFCSATVSRQVMEADAANIHHCPYGIFVYQQSEGGPVTVGHKTYADATMAPVNDLLSRIVAEALMD